MMARRLLCPLLTAQSSRLQTLAPAAAMRLPDGLSCPKDGDREAQPHLQLWVYYRQLAPPRRPSTPHHLQVQPSRVSGSFSPAASFLNLAQAAVCISCCLYRNPYASNDISRGEWGAEGSHSFEAGVAEIQCIGTVCIEMPHLSVSL